MQKQYPRISDRREFLEKLTAASAAAMALGAPTAYASTEGLKHPTATADACILIWMAGGMAAPDTFDPKHYVPFEKGVAAKDIISTFPAIDTVLDDVKFTQGLENVAQVIDRGTIIRSAVQPDLGHILHSRHQYHWHTGYVRLKPWPLRIWGLGLPTRLVPETQLSQPSSTLANAWKVSGKRRTKGVSYGRFPG